MTLAVLDLRCATKVCSELCTLGFLQPSGLLMESWSSPRLLLLLANIFCTVAEEIAQWLRTGRDPTGTNYAPGRTSHHRTV